jgi:hypothetical protein
VPEDKIRDQQRRRNKIQRALTLLLLVEGFLKGANHLGILRDPRAALHLVKLLAPVV